MFVVETEDRETSEKQYKVFRFSNDAIDYWTTMSAPYARDEDPEITCRVFKANTNDLREAVDLVKTSKAEFVDYGGLQAALEEIGEQVGDEPLSEARIRADAEKLAENPAILALARKRLEQRNEIAKKRRR